ncbi:MAG: site-2 protease family protein [Thermoflexales bacterium]|nr:site-2 protease family protein [Thermoflexales bacterium]
MGVLELIVGFLVVLGPLVFFHELGHFLMAKRAGIRVLEFGFGFPPRMFQFWRGRGHLSLGATRVTIPANFPGLPLSAAECIQEADQEEAETKKQEKPKVLDRGDYVQVMAQERRPGHLSLSALSTLDPSQDDVTPQHDVTAEGVRLRGQLTEYVPGTIYSVNWLLPVGGFTRMLGEEDPSASDSFAAAPKRWRTAVLLAGPLANLLLAVIVLTSVWMIGTQTALTCRFAIDKVSDNTPAAQANLQPADYIVSIDGEAMDGCYELGQYVRSHTGQSVTLGIERDGQLMEALVTLRAEGEYDPNLEGPLGVSLDPQPVTWETYRAGFLEALLNAVLFVLLMIASILALPIMLLRGIGLSSFIGPIGISQAGGEAIQLSRQVGTWAPLLLLIGQVSVAVGLSNLLPLPALDGGRLLFILVEWIRGRRVDPRKEMLVHVVGLGLLLLLAALISYSDIVRWMSGEALLR